MDFYSLMAQMLRSVAGTVIVVSIGLAIEQYFPAERDQPFLVSLFKIRILVTFTAIGVLLGSQTSPFIGMVISNLGGCCVRLSFGESLTARVAQQLAAVLVFDFFYYWLHRLQHKWSFLWQEHKLHHADPALNVTTAGLHHWLEGPLRAVFISVPMMTLLDMSPVEFRFFGAVISLWAAFKHANLRIHLGPLTPVLVGPQLHRLHHSKHPEHRDKNFAAFLPIYDLIFGTYCKPKPGEWPATGLATGEWPGSIGEATLWPFLGWWHGVIECQRSLRDRRELRNAKAHSREFRRLGQPGPSSRGEP
jgi:sterol desaturase/sphingolipid hydroxylase (fatty acid hydroxylase superfamily)